MQPSRAGDRAALSRAQPSAPEDAAEVVGGHRPSGRRVNRGQGVVRSQDMNPSSAPERSLDRDPTRLALAEGRSFEDFYRAEVTGLVVLARALAPRGLAEDVAQEAMLVAFRRWSEIRELANPEAYVRRTCANLAVSQVRRRLAEVRAVGRATQRDAVVPAGEHDDFWGLVRSLPRRQAQVVALHYVFDLSVADVAHTLEVSEGSVKVHLSRARHALAQRLRLPEEELP
jgi:RNA polymerase sigma-70 factor (ECF subfamily)